MRILVIGKGFVGDAMGWALEKAHTVFYHDPAKNENYNLRQVDTLDGVVLCLPTPSDEDGMCDDSLVLEYYRDMRSRKKDLHIIIKSTTSITTLNALQCEEDEYLTFSPEFLLASNARETLVTSKFFVYSGISAKGALFWSEALKPCVKYGDNAYFSDNMVEAGFMKYGINSFLATKVSFMNEMYDLFKSITIGKGNFDNVAFLMSLDPRFGNSHTLVPGPDGEFGWGGACFPKDTSEFYHLSKFHMRPLTVLGAAIEANADHRSKDAIQKNPSDGE